MTSFAFYVVMSICVFCSGFLAGWVSHVRQVRTTTRDAPSHVEMFDHINDPALRGLVAQSMAFTHSLRDPRDITPQTRSIDTNTATLDELREAATDCYCVLAQYPEPENYNEISSLYRAIQYALDRLTGVTS